MEKKDTKKAPEPLTPYHVFFLGWQSAFIAELMLHPFEFLPMRRYVLSTFHLLTNPQYKVNDSLGFVKQLIPKPSLVSFTKGKFVRVLTMQAPTSGVFMVAYDAIKKEVSPHLSPTTTWTLPYFSGCVATVASAGYSTMTQAYLMIERQGYAQWRSLLLKELPLIFLRSAPYNTFYYGFTESLNRWWITSLERKLIGKNSSEPMTWQEAAVTGVIGGIGALCIIIPIDFLKARFTAEWNHRHETHRAWQKRGSRALKRAVQVRCHRQLKEEIENRIPGIVMRKGLYSVLRGMIARNVLK